MSGGVDSSVVAALLKREGYDVVGITLQLYDHGAAVHRKGACCAGQDIHDARRVAEAIGIPHYVLDYEARFREAVIDRFAESYLSGETPIPCIECNRSIKFRDLLQTARDLGADVLATGHYVASRGLPDGRRALHRAADPDRDQSYFLYATTPEQLSLLRFPLGELPKEETRALARELGLAVADKADSQDICFVPQGKYSDIIERLKPGAVHGGEIVHLDGRVLGEHKGIIHYTVGQRRGLGLSVGEPLYVVRLDADRGPRRRRPPRGARLPDHPADRPELARRRPARQPRRGGHGGCGPGPLHPGAAAWPLALRGNQRHGRAVVAEDGVSPGQACVLYENDGPRARVLGGGTIARAVAEATPAAA